jgi:zinc transporter 1/2/3
MFGNECLGELAYEGTTAAVFMAGLFLSFLVDYLAARFLLWRQGKRVAGGTEARTALKGSDEVPAATPNPVATHMDERGAHMHGNLDERLSVLVLEAGIIFHSLRTYFLSTAQHLLAS